MVGSSEPARNYRDMYFVSKCDIEGNSLATVAPG